MLTRRAPQNEGLGSAARSRSPAGLSATAVSHPVLYHRVPPSTILTSVLGPHRTRPKPPCHLSFCPARPSPPHPSSGPRSTARRRRLPLPPALVPCHSLRPYPLPSNKPSPRTAAASRRRRPSDPTSFHLHSHSVLLAFTSLPATHHSPLAPVTLMTASPCASRFSIHATLSVFRLAFPGAVCSPASFMPTLAHWNLSLSFCTRCCSFPFPFLLHPSLPRVAITRSRPEGARRLFRVVSPFLSLHPRRAHFPSR